MVSRLFSFFLFHLLLSISLPYPLFFLPQFFLWNNARVCVERRASIMLARLHRDLWAKGHRNLFSMTFSYSIGLNGKNG